VRVLPLPLRLPDEPDEVDETPRFAGFRFKLSELVMTVVDDGPGIPPHLREAVFRPFYRIESSRNRITGGVGLGLAAARSAARAHGGDIVLGDAPSGGLHVRLMLPAA
jgi:signal transduction histidine kinase